VHPALKRLALLVLLMSVPAINVAGWRAAVSSHFVALDFKFKCVSWDPNHEIGFDPARPAEVSDERMRADLEVLKGVSSCVRAYRSTWGLERAPAIASEYGLEVIVGAALLPEREERNRAEVEAVVRLARERDNVKLVVVGNETQLRRSPEQILLPRETLRGHLRDVRARVEQPVSTAETWDWWLRHPEVAEEVDFIGIHLIPYWSGVANEDAPAWVLARYREVAAAFPDKRVVILETGWPSRGPTRGAAVAGVAEQAAFLNGLASLVDEETFYSLIEGFDQPWKVTTWEGRVGTTWGIFDAGRGPKLFVADRSLAWRTWLPWALSSCLASLLGVLALMRKRLACGLRGALFGVVGLQLTGTAFALVVRAVVVEYRVESVGAWVLVALTGVLSAILVVRVMEAAPVLGRARLHNRVEPRPGDEGELPFVSIHVPCRSEPPEVVILTVERLLALDYPDFEVVVVDNNTTDEALWRPVEAFCEAAGERVRFFHVDELEGYKAGALNYALERSNPRASLIAVVDADYVVEPGWLRATAPLFDDETVAGVQAPQSYRSYEDDRFQTWARDEYVGFFRVGMVQRNEANAIIQHGTMVVLRRTVVDEVGRWANWCIVEDTELGLRMLERGHRLLYLDEELGAGLVPSSFRAFARQRERWAYGAVRIMLAHWRHLTGLKGGLTWAQRYHFVGGWLPWIGASLHPVFSLAGIFVAFLALARPQTLPAVEYAYPLILFAALQALASLVSYRVRVPLSWRRTLETLVIGAALTPTISRAIARGLISRSFAFKITEKSLVPQRHRARLSAWLASAANATVAAGLLSGGALLLYSSGVHFDTATWSVALACQSLPSLFAAWCNLRY
jgi:cellulose synthase/poly-beta-1,6-N-acetylglucosamine synthase-like glycosyltransferase/exo-beta-1,3-glucanase (GH17 family)